MPLSIPLYDDCLLHIYGSLYVTILAEVIWKHCAARSKPFPSALASWNLTDKKFCGSLFVANSDFVKIIFENFV